LRGNTSAVPSGNHYFAGVLGGVAVAAVAIAAGGPVQASLARLTRMLVLSARAQAAVH
jgi:hypothetical protein